MSLKRLANTMDERDRQLIRACDVANADPDVQAVEQEFHAFEDVIAEPWTNDAATRRSRPKLPRRGRA